MLALRPNPAPTRGSDVFHRRGRSRQVSNAALARQASEERRVVCIEAIHRRLFVTATTERNQLPRSAHDAHNVSQVEPIPLAPSLKSFVDGHHLPHHNMIPIASPVPMKATYAPPFMRSDSPSPPSSASMSPDYYDSPPSPPRSLEDQVHVAYALDDIHLAKILLLRLKGIEVTSDDDPRIAAVQDEDFDFCFVPNGRLMDDRDEKTIQEMQARELERIEEMRRVERLRNCERKWEDEKRRMRDERVAVFQRREREERRRVEEQERRRVAEEERRRSLRAAEMQRAAQRSRRADRKIVSYDHLSGESHCRADQQTEFVYDFMLPVPSSSARPQNPPTPPPLPVHTRHIFPTPTFDDSTSIPFTDVLKSMQGQLFPIDRSSSPVKSRSRTQSQPRQKRRDMQLLDALLVEIRYGDEERKRRKGKQPAQPRRTPGCLACAALPLASSSCASSSPSSSISRTSSWLSFRGTPSSASSSSTDLTTPSSLSMTPPKSTWFASRPKSWIPGGALSASPESSIILSPPRHSCRSHTRLTPVALSDGPLGIDAPPATTRSTPISYQGRQRSTSTVRAAKEGAGVLVRRMSKFVELAKGFQNAYVTAALFSVSVSHDLYDDRPHETVVSEKTTILAVSQTPSCIHSTTTMGTIKGARTKLRPAGSRVSVGDVATFLSPSSVTVIREDDVSSSFTPPPRYIPLSSPFPVTESPRTALPDPLPYQLHFKPIPAPIRSPYRFHALSSEMHTMYPSNDPALCESQLSWRIRSVGNPAFLRLKALHNIVLRRGVMWEGSGRDTALGGGRERVVGVAYEGVGRSLLSRSSIV